jgi:hypothetical protein
MKSIKKPPIRGDFLYHTSIYVADIYLFDVSDLKTAFANNTYGRNITQTTSAIASSQNAILAINGDFYGALQVLSFGPRSSTMYFNGTVVNNPTTNGKTITERSVSDIVYSEVLSTAFLKYTEPPRITCRFTGSWVA